ncbi:MAG: M28 family peptidase, partial [Bacteroidetes bacterium]|nr:M28 family peptidase [Bacteroidota bacterium]
MKKIIILFVAILLNNLLLAQTPFNILVTNPIAEDVLLGNYDPANYTPSIIINNADTIIAGIKSEVSADSLHSLLKKLGTFHNRNTYSDTISDSIGIGAARRWVYSYFQNISADNENRLIPSYLQYDLSALGPVNCFAGQFRNTFAVLPGMDTTNPSIVIFSAHMDSRCEAPCDGICKAHGIEDNGSGTALVMELARVMSKYSYNSTFVFLLTVAEEQGLYGAKAFSSYAFNNNLPIKAVQNNDVIGGIICGNTASPPTNCTQMGQIDSMQVRIFSDGTLTLTHRGYARYIKLLYLEKLISIVDVPMTINIMNQEDRDFRGGDHQAFREKGFTAVRFTAQHEHGNGSGTPPDRTHTPTDLLGV